MGGIGTGGVLEESDINALREEALRRLEDNQNDTAISTTAADHIQQLQLVLLASGGDRYFASCTKLNSPPSLL